MTGLRGRLAWAGEILLSLGSRAFHAFALGGTVDESTSARAHYEARVSPVPSPAWIAARRWINRAFGWQADHCAEAAAVELHRAAALLDRYGIGFDQAALAAAFSDVGLARYPVQNPLQRAPGPGPEGTL